MVIKDGFCFSLVSYGRLKQRKPSWRNSWRGTRSKIVPASAPHLQAWLYGQLSLVYMAAAPFCWKWFVSTLANQSVMVYVVLLCLCRDKCEIFSFPPALEVPKEHSAKRCSEFLLAAQSVNDFPVLLHYLWQLQPVAETLRLLVTGCHTVFDDGFVNWSSSLFFFRWQRQHNMMPITLPTITRTATAIIPEATQTPVQNSLKYWNRRWNSLTMELFLENIGILCTNNGSKFEIFIKPTSDFVFLNSLSSILHCHHRSQETPQWKEGWCRRGKEDIRPTSGEYGKEMDSLL